MDLTATGDNEYEFHKDVQVDEGKQYQYKFRIGEGDWWILNEDSPTGNVPEHELFGFNFNYFSRIALE